MSSVRLPGLDGRSFGPPQVLATPLVERLLLGGRGEVLHHAPALGEADVLLHLAAQRAVDHRGEALVQLRRPARPGARPSSVDRVAGSEGVLGPEDLLVEEGEQPEQLHQLVLERGGGEEQLRAGPAARHAAPGRSCCPVRWALRSRWASSMTTRSQGTAARSSARPAREGVAGR